jgi:phosphoglycolate phosphatase-like HAD superfamily hydrolase
LKFVIVTSLYEATIKAVLRILKLEDLFDVFGCDVTLKEKKTENLKRALNKYNEKKDYKPLLMIGDRGEDIEAGKEFSLNTIYCDYGHGDSDFSADFIIKSPEELIKTIEDFFKN